MFKSILFLMLLLPGVSCLISEASAENTKNQAPLTIVDVLMKYGIGGPAYPALNLAMEARDIEAVKLLIDHGVDINTRPPGKTYSYGKRMSPYNQGQTVLEIAVERGDKSLLEYFLKKGANPHLTRFVALYIHSIDPNGTIKGELVNHTCTAVYDAIRSGHIEILSILLEGGASINEPCLISERREERTPIQAAILLNRKNMVEFLLSKGAKI
jgi:ankyrin repeat protein